LIFITNWVLRKIGITKNYILQIIQFCSASAHVWGAGISFFNLARLIELHKALPRRVERLGLRLWRLDMELNRRLNGICHTPSWISIAWCGNIFLLFWLSLEVPVLELLLGLAEVFLRYDIILNLADDIGLLIKSHFFIGFVARRNLM